MMLVNIAKAGFFSSDRTIAEYNRDIWKTEQNIENNGNKEGGRIILGSGNYKQ